MVVDRADLIAGAIYGMALGDSWGFLTEFMQHPDILATKPLPPRRLQITDDTQMSLYNARALRQILQEEDNLDFLLVDEEQQVRIRKIFADFHLDYEIDPDNNRAPGRTVMSALYNYRRSDQLTGLEGSSSNDSKGCGTIMRSPWFGLLPLDRRIIAALAVLQSETTHGHPQAALSAAVAALMLHDIFEGELSPIDAAPKNRVLAMLYRTLSYATEVEELPTGLVATERFRGGVSDFRETVYELIYSFEHVSNEDLMNPDQDICSWFGEGWTADAALLCSVGAFALHDFQSYEGIRRLVYSNGDSDSIGAIGGSFFGALLGYGVLERQAAEYSVSIRGAFEYRYEQELSDALGFYRELNRS